MKTSRQLKRQRITRKEKQKIRNQEPQKYSRRINSIGTITDTTSRIKQNQKITYQNNLYLKNSIQSLIRSRLTRTRLS